MNNNTKTINNRNKFLNTIYYSVELCIAYVASIYIESFSQLNDPDSVELRVAYFASIYIGSFAQHTDTYSVELCVACFASIGVESFTQLNDTYYFLVVCCIFCLNLY